MHAWVIILPLKIEDENKNEIPYFIEPSTDERKEIYDENYIGIEAIWNHRNYWVNLQSLNEGCMVCITTITDYFMLILFTSLNLFNILYSSIILL